MSTSLDRIGAFILSLKFVRYLQRMLASLRLLNGPSSLASSLFGSALAGRAGGVMRCPDFGAFPLRCESGHNR